MSVPFRDICKKGPSYLLSYLTETPSLVDYYFTRFMHYLSLITRFSNETPSLADCSVLSGRIGRLPVNSA
jgi:hypothetical protein